MKESIRESMIYGYMIEPINEGIIFNNPDKLLKKLEKSLNAFSKGELTFFGPDHYINKLKKIENKLSDNQKKKLEELIQKYAELSEQKRMERIRSKILEFKKFWDTGKPVNVTWEGEFIEFCIFTLGYNEKQVVNHFTKIRNKLDTTFKDVLYFMCGGDKDSEELYSDDILSLKLQLDDKCIDLYSNDDDVAFYNFRTKKFYDITTSNEILVIPSAFKKVTDIYDDSEDLTDGVNYKESDIYKKFKIDFDI